MKIHPGSGYKCSNLIKIMDIWIKIMIFESGSGYSGSKDHQISMTCDTSPSADALLVITCHHLSSQATQAKLRKRATMGKPNFLATERLIQKVQPAVNSLLEKMGKRENEQNFIEIL